jgi:hypothetical protein
VAAVTASGLALEGMVWEEEELAKRQSAALQLFKESGGSQKQMQNTQKLA